MQQPSHTKRGPERQADQKIVERRIVIGTKIAGTHWTVVEVEDHRRALCQCDCRNFRSMFVASLIDGTAATSCGCCSSPMSAIKPGDRVPHDVGLTLGDLRDVPLADLLAEGTEPTRFSARPSRQKRWRPGDRS